jgi:hypothetical protein
VKVGDLHLHALVAQVNITCVPAARPGISMSQQLRQIWMSEKQGKNAIKMSQID